MGLELYFLIIHDSSSRKIQNTFHGWQIVRKEVYAQDDCGKDSDY